MEGITQALVDHGFAVVSAVALFVSLSAVFKFLLSMLLREIKEVQSRTEQSNSELRSDMTTRAEQTHDVTIKLVDRVRRLEDTLTRLDVLMRLRSGDLMRDTDTLDRIGRSESEL